MLLTRQGFPKIAQMLKFFWWIPLIKITSYLSSCLCCYHKLIDFDFIIVILTHYEFIDTW